MRSLEWRSCYCSETCAHEGKLRGVTPAYRRQCVFERDHGVCAKCGTDTKPLCERLKALYASNREEWDRLRKELGISRKRAINGTVWDLDHIRPCTFGGGELGLENYRTLCLPCHRETTAQMRRVHKLNRFITGRKLAFVTNWETRSEA